MSDVRRFGHCQRIIALHNEISPGTDELLSRMLRHRYIRLNGGIVEVKEQFNAWLAAPRSIAAGLRRGALPNGMASNKDWGKKRPNRYSKGSGDSR
jgi:2-keto-3-deoxy-6-phosphogluconate aldolase